MRTDWQDASTRVSGTEADQVVDLWLRDRLAGNQSQAAAPSRTVHEIAASLGASEEEIFSILARIRGRHGSRKVRPAISINQTWRLIIAIYAVAVSVAFISFVMRHRSYDVAAAEYAPIAVPDNARPMAFRSGFALPLPRGFGMTFRSRAVRTIPNYSNRPPDWAKGEKAIIQKINEMNGQHATTYEPLVSPKEIESALSSAPRSLGDPESVANPADNRLVEWHPLSVNVNGQEVQTEIPAAKVTNASVEKAVQQDIKSRVEGMLAALRARLSGQSEPDPSPDYN